MKKIFFISLALLVLVLFFLGIYNFAFKKNDSQSTKTKADQFSKVGDDIKQNILPERKKITLISNQGMVAASFDKKNDAILYYAESDAAALKSDSEGKKWEKLPGEKMKGLTKAAWSANKSKALLAVKTSEGEIFYAYDSANKKTMALKKGLDTAVWDNLGNKIFYKYFDSETKTRTLNIANPDGSDWKKLTDTDIRNISIAQIPQTSLVSFWNSPAKNEETTLRTIGISGGEPKDVFKGKFGADYLWAPNGEMALISSIKSQDDNKMTLGIIRLDGSYSNLDIPTFVSKSVWSIDNKTIYYALPGEIPENAILPDDYVSRKFSTNDTFWKMDIISGTRERIVQPGESSSVKYDSSEMFLSATEDALYFINKVDKGVYKINL